MSRCLKCRKPAVHVGVVVPWDNTLDAPEVLHYCGGCDFSFLESAKDVPAMFAKIEWWLQGFDPEAIEGVCDYCKRPGAAQRLKRGGLACGPCVNEIPGLRGQLEGKVDDSAPGGGA